MTDLRTEKDTVRHRLKRARAELHEDLRRRYDTLIRERLMALPQLRSAQVIFMFISYGSEVDTHECLRELLQSGKRIAVPRIVEGGTMLAVPFDSWETLQPGQLGIPSPATTEPLAMPVDVCITPGLGFSPRGGRLGYGRGYYDRWFASQPPLVKAALAYECQLLDDLPVDENDVPMDMIITEKRVIRIS